MVLVTIITVTFNNNAGLLKTIKSVVSQSYKNIEYIIIDGGSNDGSAETINAYQDHIAYWVSEKDNGVYHAMNKGIQNATGNYLLFLNSGDVLVDTSVINDMMKGEDGTIDLVYGNLKRNFPDGTEDIVPMPRFIDVDIMMTWTLCHPVTFIHKRLFTDFGLYDEGLSIVADWAFFLKVIVLGNATQKHKDVLVANFAMDGMSSLPVNMEKIEKERNLVKATYLSPAFNKLYKDYLFYKDFYDNKWVGRARKIYKALKGNKLSN